MMNFICPKCGGHRVEEIMVDMTVASEIMILDITGEVAYGEQGNDGGHVDRYQCMNCGYTIVDHDSPHSDDGLDVEALVKAIKALKS